MKSVTLLIICAFMATLVISRPEEKYTDEFDGVDIDEILHNDRLFNNYANCLKTGQKCTPDGQKLRDILPDALQTKCQKCTDTQRRQSKVVLHFMAKEKANIFKELEDIFDPGHEYRKAYAEELKAEGIILPE